ncbi:MAG TPA: PQQ-binding-like beta-propeller repeat protein [Planctomycetota bacterium]|nr:PQQ-binding-like beta-propeller repeat protein [Planctomycetota bacterium]
MSRRLLAVSLLFSLGMLAIPAASAPAGEPAGAEGGKPKEEEFDPRVYLEEDDEVAGMIRAAWRARESDNWRLAIDKYLEAARKYGHTVFRQNERLGLPVRVLIQRELAAMPAKGREIYRVLKGADADRAYLRAAAASDEPALERVAAEYPLLDAAPRALFLLGEMSRAKGEPGRAVFYWRRLLADYPEWSEGSRAALLARAAAVSVESGRLAEAAELLGQLKMVAGLTKMRMGGSEVLAAEELEKRLTTASQGTGQVVSAGREGWWPTIGGDSSRAVSATHFVDAGVCRWQRKLAKDGIANEQMMRNYGVNPGSMPAQPPKRHPVAAGGTVVLAGDGSVTAVRAMSGSVVWKAPLQSASDNLPVTRQVVPALGDGRVYVCIGQPNPARRNTFGMEGRGQPGSGVVLRAYGMESGKLIWESGRNDEKVDQEFLKTVDLVGTPVYSGGYVYCPAVKRGSINDVHLLSFDAGSGRLAWRTFVCAAQPLSAGQYYAQTQITEDCPPASVGEGLAVLATNAGALGVLDAASGQLVWVYLYDRLDVGSPKDGNAAAMGRAAVQIPNTWAACPPIIQGGMVYAAPQDCGELLAMDLATGKLKWKARRGELSHVVGLSSGRLVLSGSKEVVALSALNGKRLWSVSLNSEGTGLGLVGQDFVIIPTKKALQRFDLATGALKATYLFKQGEAESGNLVISGDIMVSVGAEAVAGYYAWDHIVGKLRKEVETTPEAAGPRAELAEVHFSAEKYPEAIALFKEALERVKPGENQGGVPLDNTIRKQVWEAYSRLGRAAEKDRGFEDALKNYRDAHNYRTSANEEMIGQMRFAQCRESLGDLPGAVAEYHAVISSKLSEEGYSRAGAGEVQAGRFAQVQIDRLIKEKGREVYARFDGEAEALLGKARGEKSLTLVQRVVKEYPNSQAVSPALILAGELALAAGKPADAAVSLREHLWRRSGSDREPEVRARLAMVYRAQGMESLCRGMLNRLARSAPEKAFELDGRKWTVKDFVADRLAGVKVPDGGTSSGMPDLTPPLTTAWKTSLGAGNTWLVPSDPSAGGPEGLALCMSMDNQGRNQVTVSAINAASGKLAWKNTEEAQPHMMGGTPALALPGSVLVRSGSKLRCLAAGSGQVMWERELPMQQVNPQWGGNNQVFLAGGEGMVVAVASSMSFNPQLGRQDFKQTVVALDEGAGQQVWSTELGGGNVLSALIAEGLLVINSQDQMRGNRKVTAYDLADGRKHYEIGINGWGQVMQVQGDVLMVPSQNSLDCYELTTGKLKWRAAVGSMPTLVAVDDERVVIVEPVIDRNAGRNKVRFASWSVQTGKRLWSSEEFSGYYQAAVGRSPYGASAPVVPKGTAKLAVSIYDHQARRPTVLALDGASGKLLWRSDLPLNTQPPALVAGAAHVAGSLQLGGGAASEVRVWALDSGKLLYSQPMGRVGQLSVQQDLLLYVGGNGEIERLKPGEAKPDQPAPGPAVPEPPRPQVPAPAPVSAPAPAPAPVGK